MKTAPKKFWQHISPWEKPSDKGFAPHLSASRKVRVRKAGAKNWVTPKFVRVLVVPLDAESVEAMVEKAADGIRKCWPGAIPGPVWKKEARAALAAIGITARPARKKK